ncbi:MAG: hypothetical protein ACR2GD_09750 [Pyrinomonadaceae bacterium]
MSLAIACQSTSKNISNDGKVDVVGNNWIIKIPAPAQDNSSPRNIELRFVKDTNHPTIANDVSADATSMELSSVDGFPPAGKIYTFNGETIGYDSISGNTLKDLKRGIDGSTAQNHTKGQSVYLVTMQREIGDKTELQMPQMPDDYYIHYRWQTDSKDNGNTGWSGFGMVGFAPGSAASATAK